MDTMRRVGLAGAALAIALASCDGGTLDGYPGPTPWPTPQTDRCVDGLAKRHVTIPLGVGIGSDVDSKLLPIGAAAVQTNSRFGRRGEVVKRTGTRALGTGLLGTADTLPASWALGTLGGCLVSLSGSGVDHPASLYSP